MENFEATLSGDSARVLNESSYQHHDPRQPPDQQPLLDTSPAPAALPEIASNAQGATDQQLRHQGDPSPPTGSQHDSDFDAAAVSKRDTSSSSRHSDNPQMLPLATTSISSSNSSNNSRARTGLPMSTKRRKAASSKGSGLAAAMAPLLQAMQGLLAATGVHMSLSPLLEAQLAPFLRQSQGQTKKLLSSCPPSAGSSDFSHQQIVQDRYRHKGWALMLPQRLLMAECTFSYMSALAQSVPVSLNFCPWVYRAHLLWKDSIRICTQLCVASSKTCRFCRREGPDGLSLVDSWQKL